MTYEAEAGLEGKKGKVVKKIKGQKKGKIKIRGEYWWAKSVHDILLSPGEKVVVKDVSGLTVFVEPLLECPQCGRNYAFSKIPPSCECGKELEEVNLCASGAVERRRNQYGRSFIYSRKTE